MRAKKVFENIDDVLTPKTDEEINSIIEEKTGYKINQLKNLISNLKEHGVNAELELKKGFIVIKPWSISDGSGNNKALAYSEDGAKKIFITLLNYAIDAEQLRINNPDKNSLFYKWFSFREAEQLLKKIEKGFKVFNVGDFVNIKDKHWH
jgi:hypothetical protein